MRELIKNLTCKNIGMAFVFMLVNVCSVVVVTQIMGLNIPLALLMCGINTILFNIITKAKLCSFIGISGLYISGILLISEKYSPSYAMGGVIMSGILYIIFGLIMIKWQDKILKYFPKYILSFAIILIGLGLIPISTNLISGNLTLGLLTLLIMVILEFKLKGTSRLFSMAIAIGIIYIGNGLINGFTFTEVQHLEFIMPQFNLESFLTISIVSFAVVFEAIGDVKNLGDIMNIDILKEKGMLGRILIANGIGSILNGSFGSASATTYSENASALLITKYRNKYMQFINGFIFMLLAFFTPFTSLILSIDTSIFGGVLLFLYGSVVINAIKQVTESGIKLDSKKPFIVMSVGLGIFFINFTISGVTISSIAISMFVMVVMNAIIKDEVV